MAQKVLNSAPGSHFHCKIVAKNNNRKNAKSYELLERNVIYLLIYLFIVQFQQPTSRQLQEMINKNKNIYIKTMN